MVTEPYAVLGLQPDADDEAIRRRYLELVRDHSPDRDPDGFTRIRAAYESLKDLNTRIRKRLFERNPADSLDAIIEEMACRNSRRRATLETMLRLVASRP